MSYGLILIHFYAICSKTLLVYRVLNMVIRMTPCKGIVQEHFNNLVIRNIFLSQFYFSAQSFVGYIIQGDIKTKLNLQSS